MRMDLADAGRHLRDAELMRLVDGEEPAHERSRSAAHLATCERCAGEVRRLRADAAIVRGWLSRAELEAALPAHVAAPAHVDELALRRRTKPVTASRRALPWLRAAAVLLLVAAPAAAIPAVRELVISAVAELRGVEPGVVAGVPEATTPAAATIRFEPLPGTFSIEIDGAQASGTLRIEQASDEHAVLSMDGVIGEGPVVSATSLRIRNDPDAVASYALQVPRTVSSVTVRINGRVAATFDASALRAGAELPIR